MNLTIASGFRLRNKIKEQIRKRIEHVESASAVKDAGTPENTALFDGKTFEETLEIIVVLMHELHSLNLAIDEANIINRENLISLETLKASIALYETVALKCRSVEQFRYEYNAEGGRDKIALEPVLNQKEIVEKLDAFKKEKEKIEEALADSNFKTVVHFDPETVKKFL
ncbi:hypothetical protein FACS1894172_15310 [Spirochaetia bacterium]|nr:hypothetical protein FACS1894164_17650 [Spirochaetia bacterium]GHU34686.1 hypothetical protein FACS1894172_15310 [Spirochaetia bacterium]